MSDRGQRAPRQDLTPLLHARSVAIVGISKPQRFGGKLFLNLEKSGYGGRIFGVNPRYQTLFDRPCYPSLRELPERPDCALLAVPNQRIVEALREAAACGIRAAVVFASAWSELRLPRTGLRRLRLRHQPRPSGW
jgi:acyl-CoA synthetase (NDP forming)